MKQYYIQDTRQYVGNCVLWWQSRNGYTCDIDKAGIFNEEDAKKICQNRETDVAYEVFYILEIVKRHVDMRYVERKKAKWDTVGKGD